MTEPGELILSASSIKEWLRCEYAYLLGSVWRVPSPPNIDMAIGTAVHAGVERYHRIMLGRQPAELSPSNDAATATQTAFVRELALGGQYEPIEAQRALADAQAMTKTYLANIAPGFNPTLVERSFLIRLNGILVSGQIDAADEDVHDTKTTATLSKFYPARHRLQLGLYGLGYESITGHKPRRLLLDVVTRNGKWKTIEVQPDYDEVADVVGLVSSGIRSLDLAPTGAENGECRRCPYSQGVCRFAKTD